MSIEKDRIIEVNGEITIDTSYRFIKELYKLSDISKEPIFIVINSMGGDIRGLESMIAAINATGCSIITIIPGTVAVSCAAILFLQGKERIMLEGSEIKFHEPRRNINSDIYTYSELKEMLEDLKTAYDFFVDNTVMTTNLSRAEITQRIKNKDYILNAREALSIGAATKVITKFDEL